MTLDLRHAIDHAEDIALRTRPPQPPTAALPPARPRVVEAGRP